MVSNKIAPRINALPSRGCWLHRSRAICVFVVAFWTYLLTASVLEIIGTLHPSAHRILLPLWGLGIWSFATCAAQCRQRVERLFYYVGIVQMSILAFHDVIPTSVVVTRFSQFADAALSAIEIILTLAILLWHFRVAERSTG